MEEPVKTAAAPGWRVPFRGRLHLLRDPKPLLSWQMPWFRLMCGPVVRGHKRSLRELLDCSQSQVAMLTDMANVLGGSINEDDIFKTEEFGDTHSC